MKYVISDLHGRYDLYRLLLDRLDLSAEDTLYILGDCADRGPDGVAIWLDCMERPNVVLLKGNHEDMACKYLTPIKFDTRTGTLHLTEAQLQKIKFWTDKNDGGPTLSAFLTLAPDVRAKLLTYLSGLPLYVEEEVAGRRWWLSHTVPVADEWNATECTEHDLLWGEPDYDRVYEPDRQIITGHTPTELIDLDEGQLGRILRRNNHVAIDCHTVMSGQLGCFCLDTEKEIYVTTNFKEERDGKGE